MTKTEDVIGIYGTAYLEIIHRRVTGIQQYCQQAGNLRLIDFRVTSLLNLDVEPPPWRGKVKGMIICFGNPEGFAAYKAADWALSAGVPVVSMSADWFDPRIPVAYVDQNSLAEIAAQHLVECECQSFLYFGYKHSEGSLERCEALRTVLGHQRKKLVMLMSEDYYSGNYDDEKLLVRETQLASSLAALPKPIGVWALNDNYARAVCLLCERLKLHIPDQVKVLGVDDLAVARMYHPTLSSIRTPGEEIGYQAMRALHKLIEGKRGVREIIQVKATELLVRESTQNTRGSFGNLKTVLDYIERHACEGVTVEQILALVGGSQRSLSELFRKQVGHSISGEIQRVRLERAKSLLAQTQFSMTRIASMVGYAETAAFSKFFRKTTGVSPRAFREANGTR